MVILDLERNRNSSNSRGNKYAFIEIEIGLKIIKDIFYDHDDINEYTNNYIKTIWGSINNCYLRYRGVPDDVIPPKLNLIEMIDKFQENTPV